MVDTNAVGALIYFRVWYQSIAGITANPAAEGSLCLTAERFQGCVYLVFDRAHPPCPPLSCAYPHCLNTSWKLIRSMKSKDAYLKRKQDSQRHRIVEAEKMVGKKIEVRCWLRENYHDLFPESVGYRSSCSQVPWLDLGFPDSVFFHRKQQPCH